MTARARSRGYSLVVVLMTLGLITLSVLSLYAYLSGSAKSTGEIIKKRKAFYVCDGMTRMVGRLVSDYSKQVTAPPTPADAETYIYARAGAAFENIMPPGYKLGTFSVSQLERVGDRVPIPNGPFEGMLARETDLSFTVQARSTDDEFACKIEQTLALSEVGLFQFGVLAAAGPLSLSVYSSAPSQDTYVTGRVHSNDAVCLGPRDVAYSLYVHSVTAAGRVLHQDYAGGVRPECAQAKDISGGAPMLGDGTAVEPTFFPAPDAAHFTALDTTTDAESASWTANALTSWGGKVRDAAHGVGALVPPAAPAVQGAQEADGATGAQRGSLRFLVDPPLPSDGTVDRRSRLAYLADLRIIDGVWYLRDPANPDSWPGTPIWSDHPGRAVDHVDASFLERQDPPGDSQRDVGQTDLRVARGWGATPQRFSYYGYDTANSTLARGLSATPLSPHAVVSYGTLERVAGPTWIPAVVSPRLAPAAGPMAEKAVCGAACAASATCNANVDVISISAAPASVDVCGPGEKNVASLIAAATRLPIFDPRHASGGSASPSVPPSPLAALPVNFDVAAFEDALADTSAGELGSYFAGGRVFNGIVWISSLWPGAWNGFDLGTQPTIAVSDNHAIPFPLCSDDLDGNALDGSPALPTTTPIPECASLLTSPGSTTTGEPIYPWPTVVRIINARDLNASGLLDEGLTIATNLPLYVIGETNRNSVSSATAADAAADEAVPRPWVPFLVAGDSVTLGSNAWDDRAWVRRSRAVNALGTTGSAGSVPNASHTTYRMAVLTSMPYTDDRTGRPVDFMDALRFIEDWTFPLGNTATIWGSVAVGYTPVYAGQARITSADFWRYNIPERLYLRFDHRMSRIDAQPPGTVSFDVQSVRAWERR